MRRGKSSLPVFQPALLLSRLPLTLDGQGRVEPDAAVHLSCNPEVSYITSLYSIASSRRYISCTLYSVSYLILFSNSSSFFFFFSSVSSSVSLLSTNYVSASLLHSHTHFVAFGCNTVQRRVWNVRWTSSRTFGSAIEPTVMAYPLPIKNLKNNSIVLRVAFRLFLRQNRYSTTTATVLSHGKHKCNPQQTV